MNKVWIAGGIFAIVAIVLATGLVRRTNLSDRVPYANQESLFPKGPQTYQVSSNEPGPKVREVIVSEIEPAYGESQLFRVKIDDPDGVREVSVAVVRDGTIETHELNLREGDKKSGTWEGSWKLSGTANFDYAARIVTESKSGKSTVTITFR